MFALPARVGVPEMTPAGESINPTGRAAAAKHPCVWPMYTRRRQGSRILNARLQANSDDRSASGQVRNWRLKHFTAFPGAKWRLFLTPSSYVSGLRLRLAWLSQETQVPVGVASITLCSPTGARREASWPNWQPDKKRSSSPIRTRPWSPNQALPLKEVGCQKRAGVRRGPQSGSEMSSRAGADAAHNPGQKQVPGGLRCPRVP